MLQRFFFIILLILSTSFFCNAQEKEIESNKLLTKIENKNWLLHYMKIDSKIEKLKFIKSKIFTDREYAHCYKQCFIYNLPNHLPGRKQYFYECKILFLFKKGKKHYLLDINSNKNTYKILRNLNIENVKKIELVEGKKALHYVGDCSSCGFSFIIHKKI